MCWGLHRTTLGVTVYLHSLQIGVCLLYVRTLLLSKLLLWKLVGLFFRRSLSFFLLWFCLSDYVPPKFEIHNMIFEL